MSKDELKEEIKRVLQAILMDGNRYDQKFVEDIHVKIGSPLDGEVADANTGLVVLSTYIDDLIDNLDG